MIYLDNNATTPVDDIVLEAMLPYFKEHFGNASSKLHAYGWVAEQAVETARAQVATLINAATDEIVFTSGATESINIGIQGFAKKNQKKGKHIISISTEHKAVLETLQYLEKQGYSVTYLPVNRFGHFDLEQLENSITNQTAMICVMYVNNETGVINPVREVADIARKHQINFFCDATQAAGKLMIDVKETGVDLLCLSAHKMYGPKGIGALYIRKSKPKISIEPLTFGGGQENGIRPGTLNVPSIVGFGAACKVAQDNFWTYSLNTSKLRTILEQQLTIIPDVYINGDVRERICNTTNICFENFNIAANLKNLQELAFATGSACSSSSPEPSHVLLSMGLTKSQAQSSIRFSLGKYTTLAQIEETVLLFKKAYHFN